MSYPIGANKSDTQIDQDAHLALQLCKGISLDPIRLLAIKELHLQDAEITTLEPFQHLLELCVLYASNNQITSVRPLDGLEKLRVLHLSHNKLGRIEGIRSLPSLEELNIARQRTSALAFEPDSIEALGNTLRTLNARGNHIASCRVLSSLRALEELELSENDIDDFNDFEILLAGISAITTINLSDNPIVKKMPKLRHQCISAWRSLGSFNAKPVTTAERIFVSKINEHRAKIKSRQQSVASKKATSKTSMDILAASKPVPHLPPYASQYRDLLIQTISNSRTAKGA
ncbi:hypothetical protein SeMB42_g04726 [Synchytrium endobioticum]|uniref:U2A'/phosphoprotein 32 family A C-terminal domain-containing protein n=1 Tax=Synchytrium endobioticum TaxID=286115 RepID=A0A507CWA9_9FUNG|nr:hypothetical protein SeMB42_g04728 [Synchytrium endobioticum]TPX43410.1 hypothetical protein SeMB42_g04726 [Synchytrium endobioticum]